MAFVDKGETGRAFCGVVLIQYPTEEGVEWAACISGLKGLRQGEIIRRSAAAHPYAIATANSDGISVLIARTAQIGREERMFTASVKQNYECVGQATAIGGIQRAVSREVSRTSETNQRSLSVTVHGDTERVVKTGPTVVGRIDELRSSRGQFGDKAIGRTALVGRLKGSSYWKVGGAGYAGYINVAATIECDVGSGVESGSTEKS